MLTTTDTPLMSQILFDQITGTAKTSEENNPDGSYSYTYDSINVTQEGRPVNVLESNEEFVTLDFKSNVCKFVGQLSDGKIDGTGTQIWASGKKIQGKWKDGYLTGEFKITDTEGKTKTFTNDDGKKVFDVSVIVKFDQQEEVKENLKVGLGKIAMSLGFFGLAFYRFKNFVKQ